jgi:hypothetical protein
MTAFMLVKTLPVWLAMPPAERFAALRRDVEPLLAKYAAEIRLRLYDAEFYATRVTDVWVWEARTHKAFQLLVEDLRETPFWDRYFQIVEILTGVEHAYARNYNERPLSAA